MNIVNRTEHGCKSSDLVRMWENKDHKNSEYEHFLRSDRGQITEPRFKSSDLFVYDGIIGC